MGSSQKSATFDDLDDEILVQIALHVPLGVSCLSQLNLRAKRLHMSEYQPLLSCIQLASLPQVKRYADASLPRPCLASWTLHSLLQQRVTCHLLSPRAHTFRCAIPLFLHVRPLLQVSRPGSRCTGAVFTALRIRHARRSQAVG